MIYPRNSVVVLAIAGSDATLFADDTSKESQLLGLGFVRDDELLRRPIRDIEDRKQLVLSLARLGALFSRGKEWSPAELVAYYKEQGLPLASYQVIGWRAPNAYEITTER